MTRYFVTAWCDRLNFAQCEVEAESAEGALAKLLDERQAQRPGHNKVKTEPEHRRQRNRRHRIFSRRPSLQNWRGLF